MDLGLIVTVIVPLTLLGFVFASRAFRKADSGRRAAVAAFAAARGLSHTEEVKIPPREDWMNFYLFLPQGGAGCSFSNLARGRVEGREWKFFDFSMRLAATRILMNPFPFRDFTGAVVEPSGKTLPSFVMFQRTPWTSLRQDMPEEAHLPRGSFPAENDVRFGDDAFEARYCVQGGDPKAILSLFRPQLRRALLADKRSWFIEGSGGLLAVYYYAKGGPFPPETDLADIGGVVKAFEAVA